MAKTPAKTIEFLHAVPVPEVVVRRLRLYPAFMFDTAFAARVFRLVRQAHCLGTCIDYTLTLGHLMDLTVFALDQCQWLERNDRSWVARIMLHLNLEFRVHPEMSPNGDPRQMLREPIEPHDRRSDGWRPPYNDSLRHQQSVWLKQMREIDHDTGETVDVPKQRAIAREVDHDTISFKGVVVARRERRHQPENGDTPFIIEEFYHPRLEEWVCTCWLFAFVAEFAYGKMTPEQSLPQEVREAQEREALRAKIAARVLPPDTPSVRNVTQAKSPVFHVSRVPQVTPAGSNRQQLSHAAHVAKLAALRGLKTTTTKPSSPSPSPSPSTPAHNGKSAPPPTTPPAKPAVTPSSVPAKPSSAKPAPAPRDMPKVYPQYADELLQRWKTQSASAPPAPSPSPSRPQSPVVSALPPPPTTATPAPVLRSKNVLPPETRSHPTRVDDMATRYAERQSRTPVPRELSAAQRDEIAALPISIWTFTAGALRAINVLLLHNIGTVGDLATCSITDLRDWGITASILAQIELGLFVDGFSQRS